MKKLKTKIDRTVYGCSPVDTNMIYDKVKAGISSHYVEDEPDLIRDITYSLLMNSIGNMKYAVDEYVPLIPEFIESSIEFVNSIRNCKMSESTVQELPELIDSYEDGNFINQVQAFNDKVQEKVAEEIIDNASNSTENKETDDSKVVDAEYNEVPKDNVIMLPAASNNSKEEKTKNKKTEKTEDKSEKTDTIKTNKEAVVAKSSNPIPVDNSKVYILDPSDGQLYSKSQLKYHHDILLKQYMQPVYPNGSNIVPVTNEIVAILTRFSPQLVPAVEFTTGQQMLMDTIRAKVPIDGFTIPDRELNQLLLGEQLQRFILMTKSSQKVKPVDGKTIIADINGKVLDKNDLNILSKSIIIPVINPNDICITTDEPYYDLENADRNKMEVGKIRLTPNQIKLLNIVKNAVEYNRDRNPIQNINYSEYVQLKSLYDAQRIKEAMDDLETQSNQKSSVKKENTPKQQERPKNTDNKKDKKKNNKKSKATRQEEFVNVDKDVFTNEEQLKIKGVLDKISKGSNYHDTDKFAEVCKQAMDQKLVTIDEVKFLVAMQKKVNEVQAKNKKEA